MKKNNYSGRFIVFEGLDGSGQSTQAKLLKNFLIEKGINVVLTKEPTNDSCAGKKIRKILDKETKADSLGLQKLFTADRKEHLDNLIMPALKAGKFVISDRYFFSTFAYGKADGLNLQELIRINDNFLLPDLTVILDASAKICVSRIERRGIEKTLFEKEKKLSQVLENYKIFPKMFDNTIIINGEKPIREVFNQIKEVVVSKILGQSYEK